MDDYAKYPPGPGNGCPRCKELWAKADTKLFAEHIDEHAAATKPKKRFAFTLTTNGNDRAKDQRELCYAVHKLFLQKTCPIEEGGAWLEYTEQGRPHIHGWYQTETGGRVYAKVFARAWPLWKEKRGQTKFGGGFHEEMKSERYLNYASAEGREVIRQVLNEGLFFNHDAEKLEPQILITDD